MKSNIREVVIIGAGFAGLSSAAFLAKQGWKVTVMEKNEMAGGRARKFHADGFTFDMGPSWYWMPEVFERFFNSFGKSVSDYYELKRLDPSYRIYWENDETDLPADYSQMRETFENIETGSAKNLDLYLAEAQTKYEIGMNEFVYKPGLSITEFMHWKVLKNALKLDIFSSVSKHVAKRFKNQKLRQILEFPVLFLGALPKDTPALYSLMNYADIKLGTWYPVGGMYSIVEAMQNLCESLGVKFLLNEEALEINIENGKATSVKTSNQTILADAVLSSGDYHFTEMNLLQQKYRSYSEKYWDKKVLAPSCLIYYVGLNTKIDGLLHHSLFFDVPFEEHANEIYSDPKWPNKPLFYVCAASKTDENSAPEGFENLFILIPVSSELSNDNEQLRESYFEKVISRLEKRTKQDIKKHIVYKRSYATSNFVEDYHSYKGNAYGLSNTLLQTAIFKPSCRSKKVANLFYAGQFTVPGPGVPPSLISGEVVANLINELYK